MKALDEMLRDQLAADEELEELLLTKRNRAWIPAIVELLEGDENVMVVVGTGHLVGKGSVVQLLKKKGYRAEQMRGRLTKPGSASSHPYSDFFLPWQLASQL